ncbi:glycerophosphodiester phosphodiesterase [Halosegnis longus]|nr:glycerophosphodiester phosphodiesterase [Halosegnis longus]
MQYISTNRPIHISAAISAAMEIVAHRGYGDVYPENTLAAFEQAAETADWIELDVRPCRTGELVVFHDEWLGRLTNATGRVVNASWDELQTLEILDSGERIPRLDEALQTIPADTGVEIELKEWGLVEDVLDAVDAIDNPVTIISFSPLALHAVAEATTEIPLGHVLYHGLYEDAPVLGLDTAAHLGCNTVHLFHSMGADADVVETAHDRGLVVQTATPEEGPTPEVLEEYRDIGVDRISADRPFE